MIIRHSYIDSRDLAEVLAFLGEENVPELTLLLVDRPRNYWSSAGEVEQTTSSDLIPVLT